MADFRRQKKSLSGLDELPGLFDYVDITRNDIAGDIIANEQKNRDARQNDDFNIGDIGERPLLRFISFGSGSSGNCAYIGTSKCGILIDAGVDNNFVTEQLLHNGIDISSVKGIILTHDHSDHVKYAYALLRRNKHMLIYCTPKTLNGLLRRHSISRRIKDYHKPIYKEFEFTVGDLAIIPFEVSHDGTDNVGFAIKGCGVSFVIATDTGCITPRADFYIRQADELVIESNYDLHMLHHGPYPEHLKARIESDSGHLDNVVAASYLASIADEAHLRHIFLCHLSHDNNLPELALECSRKALADKGIKVATDDITAADIHLSVLPRYGCSPLYTFSLNS